MINLRKGEDVQVVVTFTENTTVDPVYYLIELYDGHETLVETITPTEESTSLERYNQFTINTTLNRGEYKYVAYQSDKENPTKDDIVGDPIEYGIVFVDSDEELEDNVYL